MLFFTTTQDANPARTQPAATQGANMHIDEQLELVGKRLCKRMEELDLTPRILQARSGLALNSVKTAMTGKKCNVGTLARICSAMAWTLFDLFRDKRATIPKPPEKNDQPTNSVPPIPTTEASSIIG